MSSFIQEDEMKNYINDYSENTKRFIQEAINSGICKFKKTDDLIIIVKKPELHELCENAIGLYFHINHDAIWAYVAINDEYGMRDWLNLGDYNTNENFVDIVAKATKAAGTCNYCHKYVGYKDIRQVSFAGKSCINCYKSAIAKDEQPGWYN